MGDFFHMMFYGQSLSNDDTMCFSFFFIRLFFLIVFPPIGVWMDQHNKKYKNPNKIIICFVLTSMFYFPGLFYALNNVSL